MDRLGQVIARLFRADWAGRLDPDRLRAMVRVIMTARPDEIGCAECYQHMARFAEMAEAGAEAAAVMPLVHNHLSRCRDCREEYEALLVSMRALA